MILTEEKAAFAAEQHGVITQYLKERRLSPDEYYDTVVFVFLDCVISGKDNFKRRAYAAMDKTVADLKAENEEKVISLYQNDDYYRTVEETLKDETDGVTELLERIRIEELLKLFAQNEREVLTLLLDGFNISEISLSLKRSVSELESTMRSIRIKAADVLPAAA